MHSLTLSSRFVRWLCVLILCLATTLVQARVESLPVPPSGLPGDENWSLLAPTMNNDVFTVALDSSGNVYAGGSFTKVGSDLTGNLVKWNNNGWSSVGSGTVLYIYDLALDSHDNLYAGGNFTSAAGNSDTRYIAKWDGTNWIALPVNSGMNADVMALTVDSNDILYAGGGFTMAGGNPANYVAKWDGTSWSPLGSGMNSTVLSLAVDSSGNLYAGGQFTTAGGNPANHIAKWDGTSWSALGPGLTDSVEALAIDSQNTLYASGNFSGGLSANGVVKWDGSNWIPLGSGTNTPNVFVTALAVDSGGNLYASGGFTTIGGVAANGIAKWDGTSWNPLGSGANMSNQELPNDLAFDRSGNLYMAVSNTGGSSLAGYVTRWTAAVGACGMTVGQHTFYTNNMPVTVNVTTQGSLECLSLQRHNTNHPNATTPLHTGYFWELVGTDSSGNPATGFTVDLTLPFANADNAAKLCRYTGSGWDCAASSHTSTSVTRTGVTEFAVWTVGGPTRLISFPLMLSNSKSTQGLR